MRAETQNIVAAIEKSLSLLAQRMNWETAKYRLEEFNARVEDPSLWNDPEAAQKMMRERQMLVDAIDNYESIKRDLNDNIELIELGEMEGDEATVDEGVAALAAAAAGGKLRLLSKLSLSANRIGDRGAVALAAAGGAGGVRSSRIGFRSASSL